MRFLTAALFWLLATVTLAVTLPTAWAQCNLVDADGYARLAQRAAAQPPCRMRSPPSSAPRRFD